MARWLLGLVLVGCNQIYGIDATRLPPDAAEFVVSGQLLHRWIESENAAVREAPLNEAFGVYLSLRTDRRLEDIAIDADGRFTFVRGASDAPYRLELGIDGEITELHGAGAELRYVERSIGRLDPDPLPTIQRVQFDQSVMGAAAVRGAVASTGIWSYAEQRNGLSGIFYDIDWVNANDRSSRHGRINAARGDVLYALESTNATSPEGRQYITLARAQRNVRSMTSSSETLPTPPLVTPLPCTKLVGAASAEIARLDDALSADYGNRRAGWRVLAVPSLELGTNGAAELATEEKATADYNITPAIHNPIVNSALVVVASMRFARTVRHPASFVGALVDASIEHVVPLACAPGSTTTIVREPPIAIPGAIRLAGVALDVDTAEVAAPGELELAWSLAQAGAVDAYTVQMFELSNIAGINTTQLRRVRKHQTLVPSLLVDPSAFVRGRRYVVAITAHAGLPDAQRLDLGGAPSSTATVYSSMFWIR